MTPTQFAAKARQKFDVIALAVSLLTAVGYSVQTPFERISKLEQDVAEIRRYAEAAAIDLCLSRPDSVLARMQLDCRTLLRK